MASLDIFGDPARLLHALGLGFWHLLTLPTAGVQKGPVRSLQRLVRGVRVMTYAMANSTAKGTKRAKAALLPLAPPGLDWLQQQQPQGGAVAVGAKQQQQQQQGGVVAAVPALHRGGVVGGNEGRDLLHTLVGGYSLIFQEAVRGLQLGRPVISIVDSFGRAAVQALVLPVLVLLEVGESTATSIRVLVAERVNAGVLRVPRYVAAGELLQRYDRLESLGRALLQHVPEPELRQGGFLGCVEVAAGVYGLVTRRRLLLVGCSTTAKGLQQFTEPQVGLVLDVADIMRLEVNGSSVQLLVMEPAARGRGLVGWGVGMGDSRGVGLYLGAFGLVKPLGRVVPPVGTGEEAEGDDGEIGFSSTGTCADVSSRGGSEPEESSSASLREKAGLKGLDASSAGLRRGREIWGPGGVVRQQQKWFSGCCLECSSPEVALQLHQLVSRACQLMERRVVVAGAPWQRLRLL